MSPSKKRSTKSGPTTSRRRHIVGYASSSRVTKPNSLSSHEQAGFRKRDLKPLEPKASQDRSSRYESPVPTSSRPLPTSQHWEDFGAPESLPASCRDPSVASDDSFSLDPDTSWEDRIRIIGVEPEPKKDDKATEGECKEAEQEGGECVLQSKPGNTTDAHQTAGKDRTSLVAHAIVYSTSGAMQGPVSFPYLDVRLRCPQRLLDYYEDKHVYPSLKTGS